MRIKVLFDDESSSVSIVDGSVSDGSNSDDSLEQDASGSSTSSDLDISDSSTVLLVDERPFLTTPLNDFTVTEGLLLLIVVFLVLGGVIGMFRRR